jgi:HD superfamily phosphohydrolase
MYLMVYFHHKAIIYDEMLVKYLQSKDCTYRIPADIESYLEYTDSHLHQHLRESNNTWAKRIAERRPYRVLFELHETKDNPRPTKIKSALAAQNIDAIHTGSIARLSKYHSSFGTDTNRRIYVVDPYDRLQEPFPIESTTEIFKKYEENRRIERLYVAPENFVAAEKILTTQKL